MRRDAMQVVGSRSDEFPRVRHRDQPSDTEVRRRMEILRHARLPRGGVVEAWAGDRPDEVRWRRVG